MASIIANKGLTFAQQWADRLVANFARHPAGGVRDQIKVIASGGAKLSKPLEYMLLNDAQRWYSMVSGEYPIKPNVSPSDKLQKWGYFKQDALNLTELGRLQ